MGTELALISGRSPFSGSVLDPQLRVFTERDGDPPRQGLGYDLVGEIVEVGPEQDRGLVGRLIHSPSPHADFVQVEPDVELDLGYPAQIVPRGVSPEVASFTALTSVSLVAVHDARISLGDDVLVSGAGTVGLLITWLSRLAGARRVVVVDPIAGRRELAERLGATETIDPADPQWAAQWGRRHGSSGVDVALETSGSYEALASAMKACRIGGTVVAVAFYQGQASSLRLGEEWLHNRLQMVSSMAVWGCTHRLAPRWDRMRIAAEALRQLSRATVPLEDLVTNRYAFADWTRAYEELSSPSARAATIRPVFHYQ